MDNNLTIGDTVISGLEPDYFGSCPDCGFGGHYMNVGRDHWGYCTTHAVRWWIGSNLFSYWRYESEEWFERNASILTGYREIMPVYPKDDEEEVK